MKILVLGGTTEARQIAAYLQDRDAVYSLAGTTENPAAIGIPARIGGFGGVEGLTNYLRTGLFTHIVDATHPFAAQMKRHVDLAVAATKIAGIHLIRPAWELDQVERAADTAEAARVLKAGNNVFLALGGRHLETFQLRFDVGFSVRSIEPQTDRAPFTFIIGRPPFSVEHEKATFQKHRIDTLVLRDSGGAEGQSKLVAARQLGLRIVVISRPKLPAGLVVQTVPEVLEWLKREQAKWLAAS